MPPSRWSGGGGGRHHPYRGLPGHRTGGGAGFRMGPAGFDRGFHGHGRGDNCDGSNYAKLFVGAVPRTATEEDIRPLFEEHGDIIEVVFIKDRRTGEQQGCCFVKYSNSEAAEKAIEALHNQYTLPGGSGPVQVRYADGERERLGCNRSAFEYKLFVASINKQATEKEIEEIFSPYGRVEDVYMSRDDMKQNRGYCFVKLSNREMSEAAINALHGTYVMSGCDQPLIVRFADPKKPRPGDLRGTFGFPGFQSRSQATSALRSTHNLTEPGDGHMPLNMSHPIRLQSLGPSSQVDTMGVPADPTNITQSSTAVILSSSQQVPQLEQLQSPFSVSIPALSLGQSLGGQLSDSQSSIQHNTPADARNNALSLQQQGLPSTSSQQQLPMSSASEQLLQPLLHQSTSSLTQSERSGIPHSASSTPCGAQALVVSSVTSVVTLPLTMHSAFRIPCNWSEHTCPDGFKYYYNCITRESWWEKPEEYTIFEQKRQENLLAKQLNSPSQTQLHLLAQSTQASQLQVHRQVQNIQ